VMKEIRMQALTQLTSTMTPEEWDYVPMGEIVKEKFKGHDILITLRTEEEVQKLRAEREQSVQNQLAIKMAEAEIAYKRSQTMAMLTKSKERNIMANKEAQTPIETTPEDDPRLAEADLQQKEVDRLGSLEQIRRDEEKHSLSLQHADEQHKVKVATDTARTAHDIGIKERVADSSIKTKEKVAVIKAKQAKVSPKAKTTTKKAKG